MILDRADYSQRERETLQRLSAAGIHVDALTSITHNENNKHDQRHGRSIKQSNVQSQSMYSNKSPLKERKHIPYDNYYGDIQRNRPQVEATSFQLTFNKENSSSQKKKGKSVKKEKSPEKHEKSMRKYSPVQKENVYAGKQQY